MPDTICFRRKRNGNGGRLHIGWRLRGYDPIWYEPTTKGNGSKMESAIGLYEKAEGEGDDPMPGEVKWHPWYDVTAGESTVQKERYIIQKQDLELFWRYCMATDPATIKKLEKELNNPGKARRHAFLKEAMKWKKKDMKRRAAKARRTGADPRNVELTESESEDEGFEADEEEVAERLAERKAERKRRMDEKTMPPPKKARTGNARARGRGAAAGRGGRDRRDAPLDFDEQDFLMSGGTGERASQAPSDGSTYDTSDPEHRDGTSAVPGFLMPFLGQASNSVHPSVEGGTHKGSKKGLARRRADTLNGEGVNADEAIERLVRETSVASDLSQWGGSFSGGNGAAFGRNDKGWQDLNDGFDDDEATDRAIRASMAPEDRGPARGGTGDMYTQSEMRDLLGDALPTPQTHERATIGPFQHESEDDDGPAEDQEGDGNGRMDMNDENAAGVDDEGQANGADAGSDANGEIEVEGEGESGRVKGENEE